MARLVPPLSDSKCDAARPRDKDYKLFDAAGQGERRQALALLEQIQALTCCQPLDFPGEHDHYTLMSENAALRRMGSTHVKTGELVMGDSVLCTYEVV